jgi:hypothetical protein
MENKDNKPSPKAEEADKDKLLDSLNRRARIFTMRHKEGDINPADISKKKNLLK